MKSAQKKRKKFGEVLHSYEKDTVTITLKCGSKMVFFTKAPKEKVQDE